MFSYIVPSIFKYPLFQDQIIEISKIKSIDEILIINNSSIPNSDLNFPLIDKVKIIQGSNDIFCNGGWNLGVESSSSEYVILATEDIIYKADIFDLLKIKIETEDLNIGIIGIDGSSEYFSQDDDNVYGNTFDVDLEKSGPNRPWGFGFMSIVKQDLYMKIPDDLKHWFGDDYLYYNLKNKGKENYIIKSKTFKFFTKESSLSKDSETQIRIKIDETNWNSNYNLKSYKILFCQGGLGDHLVLSTLPEGWNNQGYDVYLSYHNIHRNLEIYKLVWESNPYIKGFVDEIPIIKPYENDNENRRLSGEGFIESIEKKYEIDSSNKIPKIYREHNIIPELQGKTIINFQIITSSYEPWYVLEKLNELILSLGINEDDIFSLNIQSDVNTFKDCFINKIDTKVIDTKYQKYIINNIFEHCDVINSCENYITLHSGGAVLASAINNRNTYVIMGEHNRFNYETKNFIFPNQNYIF